MVFTVRCIGLADENCAQGGQDAVITQQGSNNSCPHAAASFKEKGWGRVVSVIL